MQLDDARDDEPESLMVDNAKYWRYGVIGWYRPENEETKQDDELKEYNLDTYDDDSAEAEDKEGAGLSKFNEYN